MLQTLVRKSVCRANLVYGQEFLHHSNFMGQEERQKPQMASQGQYDIKGNLSRYLHSHDQIFSKFFDCLEIFPLLPIM